MHYIALDAFVCPMCGYALLGNLVHTAGTYLHLYPSVVGTQDGRVQALVAVLLRHAQPVAQAFGIGLEDVGDERVDLPAVSLLAFGRRVQDDTYCEQVVYLIHIAMLHLHLMVDGVDGFGTTFDSKDEACLGQFLGYRGYKTLYIRIAFRLLGIQRTRDILKGVVIGELKGEIFHLRFYLVQTQTVRQLGMQFGCLTSYMTTVGAVPFFIQTTHQFEALI